MNKKQRKNIVKHLVKGLTLKQASDHANIKYSTLRNWLKEFGYKFRDGRSQAWPTQRRVKMAKFDFRKVDWSMPNIMIANKFKISRQRVFQLRKAMK